MAPSDVGKLHVEVEVKSPADKFWVSLRDSTEVFPKAFPHDYKSIDVLEGDGKAVGSVRLITYSEGKKPTLILIYSVLHVLRTKSHR